VGAINLIFAAFVIIAGITTLVFAGTLF